ncbi:hydroxyacylglutathione hydrolase [Thalassotalea sp. M1531]|uniref:Hydroxyacylglutathione hydrolase n=1 Tax=Thalassotalea algicola TaxID=2716224 RepID=A0A7Y0LBH9_9GAMM|nr:hydroxyacylglutathione hydrolase [Thalassotalea algicola]NMP31479.1 hydroxyacylglutathione hydrolase [Thalassotalea algicola]
MTINITPIHAFNDNYIWAITEASSDKAALVDPGQAQPCIEFLENNQLKLTTILVTHHHPDHVGAINELIALYGEDISVYGPANESIPQCTHKLKEGDKVSIKGIDLSLSVLDVPGHTSGHIVYFSDSLLFCGDTLFSGGCGRLFEGTAEQMHHSLNKLKQLPANTQVYCAHEYTLANLHFALAVEPENSELLAYFKQVQEDRLDKKSTIPTNLSRELCINPFLRCDNENVKHAAERFTENSIKSEVDVFAAIRRWKDEF